jgi:hypothetical protein
MKPAFLRVALPLFVGMCVIVLWPIRPLASGQDKPSPDKGRNASPVQIQMRNVNFRLARDIVLEVRALRGQLVPTKPETPITFDDPASFTVKISTAEVAISPSSLTALINSYILAGQGVPIKNVTVSIKGDKVIQKGTLHKGVDLPFEVEGSLSATEDGKIRLRADKIKSARLPIKGLLHFLGEDLSSLMKKDEARGMKIVGDDIIMEPRTMTPPPHLEGRITKVGIAGGKIVQIFNSGSAEPDLKPPHRASGFIYHKGGVLRFGKLTMTDADLQIVGDRPGVFNFFQREYQRQLVAGYSKNTPSNGLIAHMVDYSRFESGASRTSPPKQATSANAEP